jgi:hypothetical protein
LSASKIDFFPDPFLLEFLVVSTMRNVARITLLAFIAQAHAEVAQASNNTVEDQDFDVEAALASLDDKQMDEVADKLIDKLLGSVLNTFSLNNSDLANTELFKLPSDNIGNAEGTRQPTEEELAILESAAVAASEISAALAQVAADAAQVLAAAYTDDNSQDLYNTARQYFPEEYGEEGSVPHAEDVCEGQGFNEAQCNAQGASCCFWENNACWAAIDGACEVETEPSELFDEESSPDLATVVAVGLMSMVMGSAITFALFRPGFQKLADKRLPLLTSQ